jgi:hypothetical protein
MKITEAHFNTLCGLCIEVNEDPSVREAFARLVESLKALEEIDDHERFLRLVERLHDGLAFNNWPI